MKRFDCNEVTVSSTPLFDSLQILKLNVLFKLQATSFVYACLNNLAPVYFQDYLLILHVFTRYIVLVEDNQKR